MRVKVDFLDENRHTAELWFGPHREVFEGFDQIDVLRKINNFICDALVSYDYDVIPGESGYESYLLVHGLKRRKKTN